MNKHILAMYTLPACMGFILSLCIDMFTIKFLVCLVILLIAMFLRDWAIKYELTFNSLHKGL